MSKLLIKFSNVNKDFGKKKVITNFNYSFYQGQSYLLKGENGSGKSTIIKLALGLYFPTKGHVTRNYKHFRYVPELLPIKSDIKVKTYLNHILKLMNETKNKQLLDLLELQLEKPLKTLSKGNTKKILLYLAFVGKPEVIFLDEPLDGLDQNMQKKVIDYMLIQTNICYIISSHNEKYYKNFKELQVINFD